MATQAQPELVELAVSLGLVAPDAPGPHAVVLVGPDRALVDATAHAQQLLGLTAAQLHGNDTRDPRWTTVDAAGTLLPPDDRPSEVSRRTGARVDSAEIGVHRPELDLPGHHVWLRTHSAVSTDPAGVVSVLVEVDRARADELRLAESERLHRLIAETARDMVALTDLEGRFQWVSPAAETVLGRSPESLVGEPAGSLVHPEDLPALAAVLDAIPTGDDGPPPLLGRVRHEDGSWVWLETVITVLGNAAGTPVQLRTSSRDVTARIVAEQARAAAERERDRAGRLLEQVIDNIQVGITVRPVDGPILRANPALAAMVGVPVAELVGVRLSSRVSPADAAAIDDGVRAMRRGELDSHTVDVQVRRGDGSTMWARRTAVLLRDDAGAPEHLLVQVEDVTGAREAAATLELAALTDPLTGLLHRGALQPALDAALAAADRSDAVAGVLYVDLDDFKAVNDVLGHAVGDAVLQAVADRLRDTVRADDVVLRVGGDEFVVVCGPETLAASVEQLAGRVGRALAEPLRLDGTVLTVGATVGVATASDGPAAELLDRADREMYARKASAGGRSTPPGGIERADPPGAH